MLVLAGQPIRKVYRETADMFRPGRTVAGAFGEGAGAIA